MTIAVIAEKPSVARDLARVLGATKSGTGYLHGNGYVVSWAVGHLLELAAPHEIDPGWKAWRRETLPMLPQHWPLVPRAARTDQLTVLRRILRSRKVTKVICATDAGREGELIFRRIAEHCGCQKPVERLWISSLTDAAIRDGLARLRDASRFDGLAAAACGRSQADWLVGMNLSRAYTLACRAGQPDRELLSVGRVQTPTLAMIVERELEIRAFVPEGYRVVEVTFRPQTGDAKAGDGAYRGRWFAGEHPDAETSRLPVEGEAAEAVVARAASGVATVASRTERPKQQRPPLLYDLTELQRHANRLYGLSAKRTLAAAQRLYEEHKLLTYPRTDSRYLTADVARGLGEVVSAIRAGYEASIADGSGTRLLGPRFVDDSKVGDHHAIIPTPASPVGVQLSADDQRIYDLVCRRLLAAWHGPARWTSVEVVTEIRTPGDSGEELVDRYVSRGRRVEAAGWKVLDAQPPRTDRDEDDAGQQLPDPLETGTQCVVVAADIEEKTTRPPRPFTEGTLLTAMERASTRVEDEELSEAMKECGLGTPATRAEIIETLLKRGYIRREKKSLRATDTGVQLVEQVDPMISSPELTGRWEARLRAVERGDESLASFMAAIEELVRSVVTTALGGHAAVVLPDSPTAPSTALTAQPVEPPSEDELSAHMEAAPDPPEWLAGGEERPAEASSDPPVRATTVPRSSVETDRPAPAALPPVGEGGRDPSVLAELLRARFGHPEFRPYQEPVCRAVLAGHDVLLVMPTGAGKSLCYQLPGLARGGTTVVVSPLIALMEDQVAALRAVGVAADRIHSGRGLPAAREALSAYRQGQLDTLFIAPERLGVRGFLEALVDRPPTLVAIDEAHCISHWGHDFRPDYRMLGERLPKLRPAPVIAMTATATPLVQRDIAEQLGLLSPQRFIHGFRRHNIAVEVAEVPPSARPSVVESVLSQSDRRPAIVYAPSRKQTESLAALLSAHCRAAAYHAGMAARRRDRVQHRFLAGELDVIVATIAFGMGVDKPDVRTVIHTGLPGTLEGYYQEIGRAGRDGQPSRAILLFSWADRHTHEFFHQRNYPEPRTLARLHDRLNDQAQSAETLAAATGVELEVVEQAIEKLWIHGGAEVDPDGSARRGEDGWRRPYEAQRDHRQAQLDQMLRFAQARQCRMVHLVRHFGDQEDSGRSCGSCDVCDPQQCAVRRFREPSDEERSLLYEVLAALRVRDGQTTGQLHRELCERSGPDRRAFERLLGGLVRSGLIELREDSFVKDGRTIQFQRALLTVDGAHPGPSALAGIEVAEEVAPTKRPRKRQASASGGSRGTSPSSRLGPQPKRHAPVDTALVQRLTEWRLQEARQRGVPAFRILTNRTLRALAAARPSSEDELLAVSGIGPAKAREFGEALVQLIASGRDEPTDDR